MESYSSIHVPQLFRKGQTVLSPRGLTEARVANLACLVFRNYADR